MKDRLSMQEVRDFPPDFLVNPPKVNSSRWNLKEIFPKAGLLTIAVRVAFGIGLGIVGNEPTLVWGLGLWAGAAFGIYVFLQQRLDLR